MGIVQDTTYQKVTFPAQGALAWSDGIQIRIHNTDPDPEPKKTKDQKTKEKEINTAQFLFGNKSYFSLRDGVSSNRKVLHPSRVKT
jgi:hypothetical protein